MMWFVSKNLTAKQARIMNDLLHIPVIFNHGQYIGFDIDKLFYMKAVKLLVGDWLDVLVYHKNNSKVVLELENGEYTLVEGSRFSFQIELKDEIIQFNEWELRKS